VTAGSASAWRRDCDRWQADVRYSVGVGRTYVAWVDEAKVRKVG